MTRIKFECREQIVYLKSVWGINIFDENSQLNLTFYYKI